MSLTHGGDLLLQGQNFGAELQILLLEVELPSLDPGQTRHLLLQPRAPDGLYNNNNNVFLSKVCMFKLDTHETS